MYKNAYINDFDVTDYDKYLSNPKLLEKLMNNYSEKYTNKSDAYYLAFKESLDHYVLKRCLESETFRNSEQFNNYCNYLKRVFIKSETKYKNTLYYPEITNNVFLSNYDMGKLFADKIGTDFDKLRRHQKYNSTEIQKIYAAMKEHKPLSQEEIRFISDYIYSKRNNQDNLINTYLTYIFNYLPENIVADPAISGALLTCCCFIYSTDKSVNKGVRFFVAEKDNEAKYEIAHSSFEHKYCTFQKTHLDKTNMHSAESLKSSRTINSNDLYWLMMVAFHELTHQHQSIEYAKQNYSSSSLSMMIHKVLNQYMPKEYNNSCPLTDYSINHDSDELEMEADEESWHQMKVLVHSYLNDENRYLVDDRGEKQSKRIMTVNNIRAIQARRTFSMKKNATLYSKDYYLPKEEQSIGTYYAYYDINNLVTIVKNHPEVLEEEPMLKKFFKKNGEFNPIAVLQANMLESGTTHHDNNMGYELCVYSTIYCFEDLYKDLCSKQLSEEDALNITRSLEYTYKGGKHKFEEFDKIKSDNISSGGIDVKQYDETGTKFDFFDDKQCVDTFLYHYGVTASAMVTENRICNLIKKKYPKYDIYSNKYYIDYLTSPLRIVIDGVKENNPIFITLLNDPRLLKYLEWGRKLKNPDVDRVIDYYTKYINQLKEQTAQLSQSNKSK